MTVMSSFEQDYEKALAAVQGAEAGRIDIEARGHCQACLRDIAAKPQSRSKGTISIVKHGYERPGYGYLVGECPGTGHPPFELSCEFTKEWEKRLRTVYVPEQQDKLRRLEAGTWNAFTTRVYDMATYKYVEVFVERGKPLPEIYTSRQKGEPNWEVLTRSEIRKTKEIIENLKKDIEWLQQRIASWRYAPELLVPKSKGKTEGQTIRQWFEGARAELEKLPAPKGDRKSFWEWATSFPRTLAWVTMGSRQWKPSYYKAVRAEYEKMTGASPLAVERPEREPVIISREVAEKKAARDKKLAELATKKAAKAERASARDEKAISDIVALQKAFHVVFTDAGVVEQMKARRSFTYYTDLSIHDSAARRLQNLHALDYVLGKDTLDDVMTKTRAQDKWNAKYDRIRMYMREIYKDLRADVSGFGLKLKAM